MQTKETVNGFKEERLGMFEPQRRRILKRTIENVHNTFFGKMRTIVFVVNLAGPKRDLSTYIYQERLDRLAKGLS